MNEYDIKHSRKYVTMNQSPNISTYCMDLYGSQLWNYGTGYPEKFYVVWRKVTRLIWKLPFRTHCNLLHTIINCYPIEFILESGVLNFFTLVYRVTI